MLFHYEFNQRLGVSISSTDVMDRIIYDQSEETFPSSNFDWFLRPGKK